MKTILTALLLAFSFFSMGQSPDCSKYKNGTYSIKYDDYTLKIIRKGRNQTEISSNDGIKHKFKIKWLDECTYTIRMKKGKEYRSTPKAYRDVVIKARITETYETYYKLHVTSSDGLYSKEVKVKIFNSGWSSK
ncbi:MAG: hypothetical protein ACPGYY_01800 [Bacteroidia bacterium]